MKKIIMLFVAVCALAACDPTHEKIDNGGHITLDELMAKSTVTVDKAASGLNGNVISCTTSAPVNAKWNIGGKEFVSNFAKRKMKLGEYTVTLTALCADGEEIEAKFPVKCEEITDPLVRYWIYGQDSEQEPAFTPANWDSNEMRFMDNGKHFPALSDDIYWGFKTLIFDVAEASDDNTVKIMSGWWDNVNVDDQHFVKGENELPLTETIAKICAAGNGGQGHDLTLMVTSGSITINSVYYEE